jgi:hypothetical protein
VTGTFDLTLLPFYRIKGQVWPQLPGLTALTPPRRTARGRDEDHLILYFTLSGNTPLSSNEYNQISDRLAQRFYQTAGSLTAAIRTTAENLNQTLVDRNLRTTGKGQYTIGRLILGVLRGSQFIFAQCGPTHVFHLHNGETNQVHDAQIAGRGLGVGQKTPIYFSQVDLQASDLLVLCADLPSNWEQALQVRGLFTIDTLKQRLFSSTGEDLNAVVIQVRAGKGDLSIQKTIQAATSAATAGAATAAGHAPARPTSQVESEGPASRFARILSGDEAGTQAAAPKIAEQPKTTAETNIPSGPAIPSVPAPTGPQPVTTPAPEPASQTLNRPTTTAAPPPARTTASESRFVTSRGGSELPEIRRPAAKRKRVYGGMAKTIHGVRTGSSWFSNVLRKFLPQLLPGQNEAESDMGGPGLAFLAVAIPLVVVTVAALVYTRYGRMTQYAEYYSLALEQASLAHQQTNPVDVRHAWDSTIYYLDLADNYQVTQDSHSLRQEAQTALDNLDSIVRLNFQPAIVGGLSRTAQITRMVATNTDLYMLDNSHGSVIRATITSQGNYEVDAGFDCQPGTYGSITVGNLIGIEPLQMSNDYNAHLMAIDATGNLLYCGFNMDPVAASLSAPSFGWQSIAAFSLDTEGNNLYVLDPLANSVWVYQGSYGKFTESPDIFFGEQVPQNMDKTIDIAVNASDLYLLFDDGHVAACPVSTYSGVPLRCSDPVTFVDNRPERQPGPLITDAVFTQMSFAAPPDAMLYFLEPLTRAVYYFSPRSDTLELRGQYRSDISQSFAGSATAMTISPNHSIFFSIGYQVYFSANAP